jgi:predicted aconitase
MGSYKMELTKEDLDILDGKQGETLQKVLKTIVMYGETFGAKKLVPVKPNIHMVVSFGIPLATPIFRMMDELINAGIKMAPFTVDPRPLDYKNVKCNIFEKIVFHLMYAKQKDYEEQLRKIGLKDNNAFTCTCYLPEVGNTPNKGDVLSWSESSAVVYANSVLGARTNRNSGIIELLSGIIGKTPEFGFVTDEGRKAKWLVDVRTKNLPNAQILGSAIGMKVIEEVPYITGLDKLFSGMKKDQINDYLKDMGAATASNGAVGLYHVDKITPDALDTGKKLLLEGYKTYVIDDKEIKRVHDSYPVIWKDKDSKPSICFIGCPQLSINQLYGWTDKISSKLKSENKKKVMIRTILCAAPDVIEKFTKDTEAYDKLIATGAKLTYICPLMYMNNPLCSKKPVITNSNKLRTYTTSRFYTDDEILRKITEGSGGSR